MEKKVIRIGSVGLGGIWTGVHEPGIRRSPDLELVAICDIDEEKLKAAGEKYGIILVLVCPGTGTLVNMITARFIFSYPLT